MRCRSGVELSPVKVNFRSKSIYLKYFRRATQSRPLFMKIDLILYSLRDILATDHK